MFNKTYNLMLNWNIKQPMYTQYKTNIPNFEASVLRFLILSDLL